MSEQKDEDEASASGRDLLVGLFSVLMLIIGRIGLLMSLCSGWWLLTEYGQYSNRDTAWTVLWWAGLVTVLGFGFVWRFAREKRPAEPDWVQRKR